ncbi:MAG: zinc ribbon domain-containing protein [Candidatus Dormiibacterota bacterium]
MAITCARCGAQNPDGNQFCQVCGTPLTAAAAGGAVAQPPPAAPPAAIPGPPPGFAPPGFASPPPTPPVYQSPYYSPAGAAAQGAVHRTPWVLIVSAVVVLVVVMAGCGTAVALFGRSNAQTGGTGIATGVSSPSPASSPSPIASPVTLSGPSATNDGETIPVPTGWVVDSKDNESITLSDPSGFGTITVGSGQSVPSQTAQQNKDSLDKFFLGKAPDTKSCPNSKTTNGNLNGAQGIFWTLCFTLVSGSQSAAVAAPLFAGANSNGSIFYAVLMLTPVDNLQKFINEAAPILAGIQWKLK